MFGFIVLPITFLGGTYYQWTRLASVKLGTIHWLQIIVLVNPLIYINDGMRAAFTNAAHMPLYVIYPAIVAFTCRVLRRSACETSVARCSPEPDAGGEPAGDRPVVRTGVSTSVGIGRGRRRGSDRGAPSTGVIVTLGSTEKFGASALVHERRWVW